MGSSAVKRSIGKRGSCSWAEWQEWSNKVERSANAQAAPGWTASRSTIIMLNFFLLQTVLKNLLSLQSYAYFSDRRCRLFQMLIFRSHVHVSQSVVRDLRSLFLSDGSNESSKHAVWLLYIRFWFWERKEVRRRREWKRKRQRKAIEGRQPGSLVLRKKGSKTKKRMKEEEIEKGDCGPPAWSLLFFFEILSDLNQAVPSYTYHYSFLSWVTRVAFEGRFHVLRRRENKMEKYQSEAMVGLVD